MQFVVARRHGTSGAGVTLLPRTFIRSIDDGSVTVTPLDGGSDLTLPADAVVHVTFHEPNLDLAQLVASIATEVHVIGEARTQRFLTVSIRDGYDLGRAL